MCFHGERLVKGRGRAPCGVVLEMIEMGGRTASEVASSWLVALVGKVLVILYAARVVLVQTSGHI